MAGKISAPLWIFQNFILGVNNLRTWRLSAKWISSKLLTKNRLYLGAELVWELKFQDRTLLFTERIVLGNSKEKKEQWKGQ